MRKENRTWLVAIFFLVLFMIEDYLIDWIIGVPINYRRILPNLLDIASLLLCIFIISFLVAGLMSVFSNKPGSYSIKVLRELPFWVIVFTIVMLIFFAGLRYYYVTTKLGLKL